MLDRSIPSPRTLGPGRIPSHPTGSREFAQAVCAGSCVHPDPDQSRCLPEPLSMRRRGFESMQLLPTKELIGPRRVAENGAYRSRTGHGVAIANRTAGRPPRDAPPASLPSELQPRARGPDREMPSRGTPTRGASRAAGSLPATTNSTPRPAPTDLIASSGGLSGEYCAFDPVRHRLRCKPMRTRRRCVPDPHRGRQPKCEELRNYVRRRS